MSFLYCWLCEGTQNEARASKLSRKSLRVFTSIIIMPKNIDANYHFEIAVNGVVLRKYF